MTSFFIHLNSHEAGHRFKVRGPLVNEYSREPYWELIIEDRYLNDATVFMTRSRLIELADTIVGALRGEGENDGS